MSVIEQYILRRTCNNPPTGFCMLDLEGQLKVVMDSLKVAVPYISARKYSNSIS